MLSLTRRDWQISGSTVRPFLLQNELQTSAKSGTGGTLRLSKRLQHVHFRRKLHGTNVTSSESSVLSGGPLVDTPLQSGTAADLDRLRPRRTIWPASNEAIHWGRQPHSGRSCSVRVTAREDADYLRHLRLAVATPVSRFRSAPGHTGGNMAGRHAGDRLYGPTRNAGLWTPIH